MTIDLRRTSTLAVAFLGASFALGICHAAPDTVPKDDKARIVVMTDIGYN